MRIALLFAAVVAVGAAIGIGLKQASTSDSGATPGRGLHPSASEVREKLAGAPAPLAALHAQADELLPGGRGRLEAELAKLEGHPVVVNAWASWCGPCNVEAPVFQRVALDRGREVAFLGVNEKDSRGGARRFSARYPMTYPSVVDPNGAIYNAEGMLGMPTTIFYDARGRRTTIHTGPYTSAADLEADIDRYAVRASS